MAVVMIPRDKESWNDDRLDDLKQTVDDGFREMREEFRAVRSDISATNHAMMRLFGAMWATTVVGFLGVIATILKV